MKLPVTRRLIPRVYVDTSVFGGVFDESFQIDSQRFFRMARTGQLRVVTSGLVTVEIARAPNQVQEWYDEWLPSMEVIDVDNVDALRLARAYVDTGVVTAKWLDDAMHVSYATIAGCQLIVSWNFKHIVNYQKVPQYNAVNALLGYNPIAIYSPMEVISNEEEEI